MVMRCSQALSVFLWLIAAGCSGGSLSAQAAQEPFNGLLEVVPEPLAAPLYEQEMLLISIRGYYPLNIVREKFEPPLFGGAGWMQLGKDKWAETLYQGQRVSGFERKMAIFPQQSGRIVIPPFLHSLTYMQGSGKRILREFRSAPVPIDVQPKPADRSGLGGGWWLPARGLTLTESWDRPPDQLEPGALAHRSVTLEARGVAPELLPPTPPMTAGGVMTFVDPEERSHELTPEGPVSRVTWHWTIRLATSTPGILEEVRIPWFDTRTREVREELIPQQRIAQAGVAADAPMEPTAFTKFSAFALPVGLLIGSAAGAFLVLPGLRLRSRAERARLARRFTPDPLIGVLRRAARAGDAAAVRMAAYSLIRRDREEGRSEPLAPDVATGLTGLDRALFAPPVKRPDIDLRSLVKDLLKARRARSSASQGCLIRQ
jgi:hypothetical protein